MIDRVGEAFPRQQLDPESNATQAGSHKRAADPKAERFGLFDARGSSA